MRLSKEPFLRVSFWSLIAYAVGFVLLGHWASKDNAGEAVAGIFFTGLTYVGILYSFAVDCLDFIHPTKLTELIPPPAPVPFPPLPAGITDPSILRRTLRILFIDDELPAAAGYLQSKGYNVTNVADIDQSSIEKVLELEYHIIFLDIYGVGKEFGGDGVGILRRLKSAGRLPYVAVYSAQQWSPGDPTYEDMFRLSDDRADKQRPETFEGIVGKLGRRAFSIDGLAEEIASVMNGSKEEWNVKLSTLPANEAIEKIEEALANRDPERRKALVAMARTIQALGEPLKQ